MKYKLMIVDDQTLLVDGLTTIINCQDDMEVVGTAENGAQALELIERVRPQVEWTFKCRLWMALRRPKESWRHIPVLLY
ncbi:MAG: hypothetical protein ACQEXQ_14825 [Bacillota bacterium]